MHRTNSVKNCSSPLLRNPRASCSFWGATTGYDRQHCDTVAYVHTSPPPPLQTLHRPPTQRTHPTDPRDTPSKPLADGHFVGPFPGRRGRQRSGNLSLSVAWFVTPLPPPHVLSNQHAGLPLPPMCGFRSHTWSDRSGRSARLAQVALTQTPPLIPSPPPIPNSAPPSG
jgi:hypothetical protein